MPWSRTEDLQLTMHCAVPRHEHATASVRPALQLATPAEQRSVRAPPLHQVISPFSLPTEDANCPVAMTPDDLSPFSIRQPKLWCFSDSSSSSQGLGSEEAVSMPEHRPGCMPTGISITRSLSDGALELPSSSRWSQNNEPMSSCSLPAAHCLNLCNALQNEQPSPVASLQAAESDEEAAAFDHHRADIPDCADSLELDSCGQEKASGVSHEIPEPGQEREAMHAQGAHQGAHPIRGPLQQRKLQGLKRHASQSLSARMNEMQLVCNGRG